MPHYINTLSLTFNLPLHHEEIEFFRKGICAIAGKDNDLFHNEKLEAERDDPAKYIERYPLIQYQVHGGKASVIGINEGAQALDCMERKGLLKAIKMPGHGRPIELGLIERRQDNNFALGKPTKSKSYNYRIYGYLPLNRENYKAYKGLADMKEKITLLEKLLGNHIISFSYGVGWEIPPEKKLKVSIIDLDRVKKLSVLGADMMGFDMVFSLNTLLPDRIGLGRKTAFGYGWIYRLPGTGQE